MRKLTLLIITLILSMSLVNADETNSTTTTDAGTTTSTDETTTSTDNSLDGATISNTSDATGTFASTGETRRDELKKLREEERLKIEANKSKIKENRENFRVERGTGTIKKVTLSEEIKNQIKKIYDEHKISADEIRVSIKNGDITKEEGYNKLEELRKKTYESIKALVGDNEEAMRILSLKKDMLSNNMEIRKDNLQVRKDFRDQRQELRAKYKEKFVKALGTKLDNLKEERLQKVLVKIDAAIEKTIANKKLSEANKNKILAQLDALKDIINSKLGINEEAETLEVNIDELLAE